MASLPDDLKTDPTLMSFKGEKPEDVLPVLAKSYRESRALIGKKAYDLPSDAWKPEQWTEWNKTIGVPEAPDKYPAIDEAMVTKSGVDKAVLDGAMKRFHELGLTPRQAKGLLNDWYLPNVVTGAELQETQRRATSEAAVTALKTEYGDKYPAKAGLVKSVLALGGKDFAEQLEKAGFGNDPAMFKTLVSLGEKLMEDTSGKQGGLNADSGPEAAQKRISEIKAARIADSTLESKYADPRSAEHREWTELHAKAYPA
jgi:hypothetical protein